MAAIDKLLEQVTDTALRGRLQEEFYRALQNKKFGLVFEEHMPECTPLYGVEIKRGGNVAKNDRKKINTIYTVLKKTADTAVCRNKATGEMEEIPLSELVAVAEFGEAIFPCLQPIDKVENAPDSDLWHTLIEADNYHALQLLEYLYTGKVDCIYIDPPYNTGAKDWKYNNDYVDGADSYRHSKWLSMMKKRLKLAKRLLNPEDSVLIVTIDEKEYLHLGCLLEEMFPEARMQMISTVISRQGATRQMQFGRVDEYIYILEFGDCAVQGLDLSDEWRMNANDSRTLHLLWQPLLRGAKNGRRQYSPGCFYPIYISEDGSRFIEIGDAIPLNVDRHDIPNREGAITLWPIRQDGTEGVWSCSPDTLRDLQKRGYVHIGKVRNGHAALTYLKKGNIRKVENGSFKIEGYNPDGSIISTNEYREIIPGTQWRILSHDASRYGTNLLNSIVGNRFVYPKSLYAVHDVIRFFVANKPNSLIVDFFAGSGTTLHAVNLLNKEDNGNRRCIMVTNNEVSTDEAKVLEKRKLRPGDPEWEALGIARYVTWPRTVCSIEGHDVNGNPLKGTYIGSDISMADGFAANCEYFKLGFLDRNCVSLGMQFEEILPLLWLKSGAVGKRPELKFDEEPIMLVLPENRFAVLVEEAAFSTFAKEVAAQDSIDTVYFVTNSESAFHEMSANIGIKNTHQLYREYIDNFVIGARRNAR